MTNCKVCERKWAWSKLRWETSVRTAGLRTEIRTLDLPNTKQECLPLVHVVPWGHKSSTLQLNLYLLHLMCSSRVFRTARRTPWRRVELCALRTAQITRHIATDMWLTQKEGSASHVLQPVFPKHKTRAYPFQDLGLIGVPAVPLISQSVNRHWPVPWSSHNYRKPICSMFFISQFVRQQTVSWNLFY
jgi:hypothetical protein